MLFSFAKKVTDSATDITALKNQLEAARRRITELTLDNITQANEIVMLNEYRGTPALSAPRPMLMLGREITTPLTAANSEIGLLHNAAAS